WFSKVICNDISVEETLFCLQLLLECYEVVSCSFRVRVQIVHQYQLSGACIQSFNTFSHGVHLALWNITRFNAVRSFLHQLLSTLLQPFVSNMLGHLHGGFTTCPLKEVGVAVVMRHRSELPYPCVCFVDS